MRSDIDSRVETVVDFIGFAAINHEKDCASRRVTPNPNSQILGVVAGKETKTLTYGQCKDFLGFIEAVSDDGK